MNDVRHTHAVTTAQAVRRAEASLQLRGGAQGGFTKQLSGSGGRLGRPMVGKKGRERLHSYSDVRNYNSVLYR